MPATCTTRALSRPAAALLVIAMAAATAAAQQSVAFHDDFENGNAKGWSLGNEWQIGAAQASAGNPQCLLSGDPGSDAEEAR